MTDQATTTAADRRKYQRQYYQERKADRAAYQREYRRKHKAEYVAYCRQYYQEHKAEYAAYQREYRAMCRETKKEREADEPRHTRRERKTPGDRMTREELRMFKCKRTVPLHYIMKARVKPKGVSDVRWRIELSRRRLAAKERSGGGKGDLASLPDPDMMW